MDLQRNNNHSSNETSSNGDEVYMVECCRMLVMQEFCLIYHEKWFELNILG